MTVNKRAAGSLYFDRYGASFENMNGHRFFQPPNGVIDPTAFMASVGTSISPTTTEARSIRGTGFQPRVVLPFGSHITGATDLIATLSFGCGTIHNQGLVAINSQNAISPSDTEREYDQTKISSYRVAGTQLEASSLNSLDNDGFTLNWNPVNASERNINHIALGGADLEVSLTLHRMNNTNAHQSFTHGLAGGRPSSIIAFTIGTDAFANSIVNQESQLSILLYDGNTCVSAGVRSKNGVTTTRCNRYLGNYMVSQWGSASNSLTRGLTINSADSTNINVSYTGPGTTASYFWILAIRGAKAQAGTFDCNGSLDPLTINCSGIIPKLFLPIMIPSGVDNINTVQNGLSITIGASDGINTTSCGITDEHEVTTTNTRRYQNSTGISQYDFDGTLESDLAVSFSGESVILDPSTNTGTAWGQGGYLILGQ